jgi:hypothetical protein
MFRVLAAGLAAAAVLGSLAMGDDKSASAAKSCPKPPALPGAFAATVDNPYFPLTPGTTLRYKGKLDGQPTTDVFAVTTATKTILGVRTTVVHDQVFAKGELVEDTDDWYAQDAAGNVLVLRRGHEGARQRPGRLDRGLLGGRRGQREGRDLHARAPRGRSIVQAGRRERRRGGLHEDCRARRVP